MPLFIILPILICLFMLWGCPAEEKPKQSSDPFSNPKVEVTVATDSSHKDQIKSNKLVLDPKLKYQAVRVSGYYGYEDSPETDRYNTSQAMSLIEKAEQKGFTFIGTSNGTGESESLFIFKYEPKQ